MRTSTSKAGAELGAGAIAPGYLLLDPVFFATGGATVIRPTPERYFELPLIGPLPEALNFIQ